MSASNDHVDSSALTRQTDEAFVQRSMERAADFRVLVDDQADMVADNTPINDEELRLTGPMVDV
jgi:hypothetical protein